MSKISDLDLIIQELRAAAQSLMNAADGLTELHREPAEGTKAPEPPKPPTLEQVRAVLAEKSRDGHTDNIRELLKEFGADRLSEVAPECYEALLRKAEGLT